MFRESILRTRVFKEHVRPVFNRSKSNKVEAGNGTFVSESCISLEGSSFGKASYHVMHACPLVRALGKIVQDDNKPFVWIPGELPFGKSKDVVQIAADESQIIQADRVEDGVPIFKEVVQLHSTTLAFPASKADRGAEPEGESSAAPPASEVADESEEEAGGREELLRESMSLRHRLCHMPKNPFCETCRRARMYKRRTVRTRADPLTERGMLPPVDAFGQRLASDFIVASKTSDGTNESYALT